MSSFDYDLAVIGSGPAGQRAAVQSAKIGKRVAIIEKHRNIGGGSAATVTSSKTLREAALFLSGYSERNVYSAAFSPKANVTLKDLMARTGYVMQDQGSILRNQLSRNRIDMINAEGSFVDRHTVKLSLDEGEPDGAVTADKVVIAVGSVSTPPPVVHVDGKLILVSDDVGNLEELPTTMTVVGAGVIGMEYCSTFAALGVRVTVVDRNPRPLPFLDDELADTLVHCLRQNGVTFRPNENVFDIEYYRDGRGNHVRVMLESGKRIASEAVMYCVGRTGNTDGLNLEAAGLEADDRGRLSVDENYQTAVDGIYAVGGVIGFPDLVSTSQMQGRLAAAHAFDIPNTSFHDPFPYAIKTIPEVASVGLTETELNDRGIPYETGRASFRETAESLIISRTDGFLKLLFHLDTHKLLGVHIIGEGAAELVHIGQAVMAFEGTLDYFTEAVFSYPTLAECYMTAALNGINRLR